MLQLLLPATAAFEPLLPSGGDAAPTATGPWLANEPDPALAHVMSATTLRAGKSWLLYAAIGLAVGTLNELASWTTLGQRHVSGCSAVNAMANSTIVFPSDGTLAMCSELGLLTHTECAGSSLLFTTAPASAWGSSLLGLLGVTVLLWAGALHALHSQTLRAARLLPHRVFTRVHAANGGLLFVVLLVTGAYCAIKYEAFESQPRSVVTICEGVSINVVLTPVFAGAPGLWGLVTSTLLLLAAFSSLYTTAQRYSSDCFADVGLQELLLCPTPAPVCGWARSTSGAVCTLHAATAPCNAVVASLARAPFLVVDSAVLDTDLRAWHTARGMAAMKRPWYTVRWLNACSPAEIADAAAFVRAARGGTAGSVQ